MTDEILHIKTEEIQTDGRDSFHFHRYEPTPYPVLDEVFKAFSPRSTDVVVDYGSGLGRLNFYLEHLFHIRSKGIEMSDEYYERSVENLNSYNGNRDNISFYHAKAEDYIVSDEDTVFYFFNPFSVDVFRRVINQIMQSWEQAPRTLTLILYYPEDDTFFYLLNHTSFQLVGEFAATDDIRKDRRERFCMYQLS